MITLLPTAHTTIGGSPTNESYAYDENSGTYARFNGVAGGTPYEATDYETWSGATTYVGIGKRLIVDMDYNLLSSEGGGASTPTAGVAIYYYDGAYQLLWTDSVSGSETKDPARQTQAYDLPASLDMTTAIIRFVSQSIAADFPSDAAVADMWVYEHRIEIGSGYGVSLFL